MSQGNKNKREIVRIESVLQRRKMNMKQSGESLGITFWAERRNEVSSDLNRQTETENSDLFPLGILYLKSWHQDPPLCTGREFCL